VAEHPILFARLSDCKLHPRFDIGARSFSVAAPKICTRIRPTKTDEPIEVPFALWSRMGPENHLLGGAPDPLRGRGTLG